MSILNLKRADWLALGLITLVVIVFFAPVWLGGGWLPYGGGDLVSFLWPSYNVAARALPAELPLWNPHLYSGAPFWADNQSAILYPPNLLLFLFSDNVSYQMLELLVALHIWLAGVGMVAMLRLIRPKDSIQPAPAALGAIAFMLSDLFITHQGNLNLIAVAAWLPIVFLGTWRALAAITEGRGGWLRWALLAGITFGISTLAGHAQMTYFIGLTVGGAVLWWFGVMAIQRNWQVVGRLIGGVALIGLLTFGISAASLLPTLEMTGYTARSGLSYEEAAQYSLPPQALVGLVVPTVYGRGPADFSGDWNRVEVGYMGALALALALVGAVIALRRRDGVMLFMLLLAILALLMALGEHFPLHRLAYAIIPGMSSIRVPARFVLIFNFAGAALAAYALQALLASDGLARLRVNQSAAAWIVAGIVALELIIFGAGVEVQADDPRTGYEHTDALAWLEAQPNAPFRIEGATPLWQPNTAALHGGPLFDIYGISNPLTLGHYEAYYWSLGYRGSPAYNFLGAKYIIAGSEEDPPGDASLVSVYEAESGVNIYLNTQAEPMAHLVYKAEVVDAEAAFAAVHDPDWMSGSVVYVEDGPALHLTRDEAHGSLFYTVYEANAQAVVVTTTHPAYLVLSEVWYPGWQATIDGEPAPIYRANSAFRAVYLPEPGEHTVLLAFRPTSVIIGLAITAISSMALCVSGIVVWWKRRFYSNRVSSYRS